MNHPDLARFAWISIAAAVATILLKGLAWWLTGSVGLLSDAMESFVNLAGASMMLAMLTVAARPADDDHSFGHTKAEYFASGLEGMLILLAAIGIAVTAMERLVTPRALAALANSSAPGTGFADASLTHLSKRASSWLFPSRISRAP